MQSKPNPLIDRLNRLIQIDDLIPINKDFLLGYILKDSSNVAPQTIKDLTRVIELLFDVQDCQIIQKSHVLEFVVVFSHLCENFQKHHIKSPMQFYEKCIEEIVNDHDYLKNKYFSEAGKIKKNLPKMQEPKPKSNIMEVESMNMVRNNSDLAQCPVCMVQIKHENISVLICGHIIHKQCFQQCMKESIMNKRFPLKCPFQECNSHIQSQDIEEYLNKELIEKFYEFTLHNFVDKNAKNMSWCPTPGCTNAFQFDQSIESFNCIKCAKNYCLKCKTEAHNGKTCEQNQELMNLPEQDKKFLEFVQGAKYKQCPECKFWVEKNHGCCHMTCRCSYEFCYVCGKKHGDCNCQVQYPNYYGSDSSDQDDQDNMGYVSDVVFDSSDEALDVHQQNSSIEEQHQQEEQQMEKSF